MNIFNEKPKFEKVEESPMGLYNSTEEFLEAKKKAKEAARKIREEQKVKEKERIEKEIIETNLKNRENFLKNKEDKENYLDNEENFQRIYTKANRLIGSTNIDREIFIKRCKTEEEIKNLDKDINEEIFLEEKYKKGDLLDQKHLDNKKRATILEGIIAVGITHGEWFGNNIKIHPATKHDDFKNHIDGILEIDDKENPSNYVALGVDASFRSITQEDESEQKKSFDSKIISILDKIDEGQLLEVKYFMNNEEEPMDKFYVPKIVLSSGRKILNELSYLFDTRDNPESNKKLKNHHFSSIMFEQILTQCYLFSFYAKEKKSLAVADAYDKVIKYIENLSKKDKKISKYLDEYNDSISIGKLGIVAEKIKNIIEQRLNIKIENDKLILESDYA